ncbi:hypothetical protein [Niabella beijingensis]|uniref:hypothetical protein n=1 Tax=Niabella beijingensis TaxID=2872700 RepID=UPI001CBD9BE0|nr:hypothetical protein [Niabella beijingensis]MBZ4190849.1 hypothetical protein [Niabella beijingensis]
MFITLFIISRLLLIACFVLVIGYIFGSFATNKTLSTLARVAAILLLVGFIASNIFFFRFRNGNAGFHNRHCWQQHQTDSVTYKGNPLP